MLDTEICKIGPVLDAADFPARFCAHVKGNESLGYEGSLLAMLLVVWASSFGVDEQGVPFDGSMDFSSSRPSSRKESMDGRTSGRDCSVGDAITTRRGRKEKTEALLREVLELVDMHAVMRRPTWDGVRVLLLILPLLEGEDLFHCIVSSQLGCFFFLGPLVLRGIGFTDCATFQMYIPWID